MKKFLEQELKTKIKTASWSISWPATLGWQQEVLKQLQVYKYSTRFKIQELMHYLTLEELTSGQVTFNPDQQYFQQLVMEQPEQPKTELPTPLQTLGETIKPNQCPKCQATETFMMPIQTRAADEPTNYFYQCLVCNKKWKN